ncbi:hypothetical protein [Aestuariivivens marinum]|uniref:hypothetical protein n=1 Tax=Aestuariivivens marinum TaxID=2913555 RepID=UPI001F570BC3|nr:hypothetical protein [Aestuariivivens marinum]
MNKEQLKRNITLGILFLLPVFFVLVMSLSKENFETLDIVNSNVEEISSINKLDTKLEGHLTVLGFFGKSPKDKSVEALNLKEVIYDKFKGFKKFQVVILVSKGTEKETDKLFKEIASYEDLRFWHFVHLDDSDILNTFHSLKSDFKLKDDLSTNNVFIVDSDLNQRGRLDDREDREKVKGLPIRELDYYSCTEIAELKNKLAAEDLRILFTEYRQKRKGKFNTDTRRANDLKEKEN